jgi:hypothetical protein
MPRRTVPSLTLRVIRTTNPEHVPTPEHPEHLGLSISSKTGMLHLIENAPGSGYSGGES